MAGTRIDEVFIGSCMTNIGHFRAAGRVLETLAIVRQHGGAVTGVAAIVDRSNGIVDFGVPFLSLLALAVEAFEPDHLPADLAVLPAVKPGSK